MFTPKNLILPVLFFCFSALSGQSLLQDVTTGSQSSKPLFLGEANGQLFFTTSASGGFSFYQPDGIWSTDGTRSGTIKLRDIDRNSSSFYYPNNFPQPNKYCFVNDRLVFSVKEAGNSWSLWRSDGSVNGTTRMKDFADSLLNLSFAQPKPVLLNGSVFFFTVSTAGNVLVWKTDGTTAGTLVVKNILPSDILNAPDGMPLSVVSLNGHIYFSSLTNDSTAVLWKTDGTNAGTIPVFTFHSDEAYIFVPTLGTIGNQLLLQGYDSENGYELWMSDGTTNGTRMIKEINPGKFHPHINSFTNAGNKTFFIATDIAHGQELWITDGTATGTRMIRDLCPGTTGTGIHMISGVSGTKVLFTGSDVPGRYGKVCVSDGTEAGTFVLPNTSVSLMAGPEPRQYRYTSAVVIDGKFYFQNFKDDITAESEIWVTDGTVAGTNPFMSKDNIYVMHSLDHPFPLAYYKKKIYFCGINIPVSGNSPEGFEPYYTDDCICPESERPELFVNLFPNPSAGKVFIDLVSLQLTSHTKADLVIYDAAGRRVKIQSLSLDQNCKRIEFDTYPLSQGTYIAYLITGKEKIAKKFVVAR
jgi:ELWxxDGT repeat protein